MLRRCDGNDSIATSKVEHKYSLQFKLSRKGYMAVYMKDKIGKLHYTVAVIILL